MKFGRDVVVNANQLVYTIFIQTQKIDILDSSGML